MKNKGIEIAKFIKNTSPDNMYILCKSKISEVGEWIFGVENKDDRKSTGKPFIYVVKGKGQ